MLLDHVSRPFVAFDPSIREHRKHYDEFIKAGSWGKCPVRFYIAKEETNNLVSAIERKLTAYYTNKEFAPRKKVAKSAKTPLDNQVANL